jgi:hypothetical protein
MYTNTQTVATLKGKGVDIEFVKPESGSIAFLHHHAHRQGQGRDGRTPTSTSTVVFGKEVPGGADRSRPTTSAVQQGLPSGRPTCR